MISHALAPSFVFPSLCLTAGFLLTSSLKGETTHPPIHPSVHTSIHPSIHPVDSLVRIFYISDTVLVTPDITMNNKNIFLCMCIFIDRCMHMCMCLVAQSCPTLWGSMDRSPPGSSVHGIFQADILGWVAISYSRASFQLRDWTQVSCISWIGRQIPHH